MELFAGSENSSSSPRRRPGCPSSCASSVTATSSSFRRVWPSMQLEMLVAFGVATEASLWTRTLRGGLACALQIGTGTPGRRASAAARATVLENQLISGERAQLHAVPVRRCDEPYAALVVRSRGEGRTRIAYATEAALTLAPLLEIEASSSATSRASSHWWSRPSGSSYASASTCTTDHEGSRGARAGRPPFPIAGRASWTAAMTGLPRGAPRRPRVAPSERRP